MPIPTLPRTPRSLVLAVSACAVALAAWLFFSSSRGVLLQVPSAAADLPFPSPLIRVNLTPSPAASIELEISGAYRIRPVGDERDLGHGSHLASTKVVPGGPGIQIGSDRYAVSRLELVPDRSPAIWINGHQYRGTVRLYRRPGNRLIAINVLPLEEYVASVIDSEMPAAFGDSARQAQAIVARTYALVQMQRAGDAVLFDVYATERSQKYLGFQYRDKTGRRLAGESENSRRIARETRGIVCVDRGRVFCTYYSAACGGHTTLGTEIFSDAARPLTGVPCDWCRDARLFRWNGELAKARAGEAVKGFLQRSGKPFGTLASMRREPEVPPGRVPRFIVGDGSREHRLSGVELRQLLPSGTLYSPDFDVREAGETLVFEGRGHGHGVGFCQWGAGGQARAGRDCIEILRYYYPGSDVVSLRFPE